MSKRGLSREEKRTKMMELFHEKSEFFTLKELEKNAPKQKGIGELAMFKAQRELNHPVQQSVKEILDELQADGLVTMEKIGTSNYYWSFPSTAGAKKQADLDRLTKEADTLLDKITEARTTLASSQQGREDTPERRQLLATLADAETTRATLKTELAAYGAADPVKYQRKRQAAAVAKKAAQRWHDNVDAVMSFIKSQHALDDEAGFRHTMGMGDDWDDIDFS
ncbi:uncharacterized protein EHS24_003125 [Apiotrichum porosum]|uniref:Meiotic nuclear division protein 1 n=1 Tax=Apiotrichum porosum TaxID=105984 RepID=A0A427XFB5_9TREE|nr:uncharacterized protein EHS24_003125 [Apiotrichum porosum]RSH77565.1 hypothetical protein EHS24_003125 [Apiotrichum porosum]